VQLGGEQPVVAVVEGEGDVVEGASVVVEPQLKLSHTIVPPSLHISP